MQKYLNVDPMDGSGLEVAGLLHQQGDEESPSLLMHAAASGAMPMTTDASVSTHSTAQSIRTHHFGSSALSSAAATASSGGYIPPGSPYAPAGSTEMSNLYEASSGEEATANPLAPRYPLPTISAIAPGPAVGLAAPPPPASSSKAKKALKEPKSMRSST